MEPQRALAVASYIVRGIGVIRAAAPKPWKKIHKAADDSLDSFTTMVTEAFKKAHAAIDAGKLRRALDKKDHAGAEAAVEPAVISMKKTLAKKLPDLLTEVVKAGGDAAAENLNAALGLRAAAPKSLSIEMQFDVTNPKAVKWVKEHALRLVDDLSKTTIENLRDVILSGFEEEKTVDEIAKEIADVIDDSARAEMIARTETMEAANEGQSQLWDQAIEDGFLTGKERQVWIVTDDDRLCPECADLDGEEAELDGEFPGDGGDGPPLHPNCRCTVGLVL